MTKKTFYNSSASVVKFEIFDGYKGLSSIQIRTSLRGHARDLPDLTCSVRYEVKPEASKEDLQNTWKQWIEQHGETFL